MHVFGYLDAGSGALLLQALIGGVAGIAAFMKYRWRRWTGAKTEESISASDDTDVS